MAHLRRAPKRESTLKVRKIVASHRAFAALKRDWSKSLDIYIYISIYNDMFLVIYNIYIYIALVQGGSNRLALGTTRDPRERF